MKKTILALILMIMLLSAKDANAQFAQNQIVFPTPTFGGFLYASSTASTSKVVATTSPTAVNFYVSNTLNALAAIFTRSTTTSATTTNFAITGLSNTVLAVNANGSVIATTTGSGSGSGTVNSGLTGQIPYYAANGTTLTATSSIFLVNENVAIGTTTPAAKIHLVTAGNTLAIATSTVIERSVTNTSSSIPPLILKMTTTGSANDGFGSYLSYWNQDAGGSNEIGRLRFTRSGANNSGQFDILTANAGVFSTALTAAPSGAVTIPTFNFTNASGTNASLSNTLYALNASTSFATTTELAFRNLSSSYLSVDLLGRVIATTTPTIAGVTAVTGTSNRITSTGGATPVIDISSSYVGQASITTLGTIATGVWNGTAIANANLANSTISGVALGGTLANLTATDSTLTFSGTYTGATARTIGLNLANGNVWTASTTFALLNAGKSTTTNATTSTFAITGLSSTFLAVDQNGSVIATTTLGSGSGTVVTGLLGQIPWYAANGTTLTPTSTIFLINNNVGVGTTSPVDRLAVVGKGYFAGDITGANIIATSTHISSLGTVSLPSYTFLGDTNTGIYSTGADLLDFTTGGVWRGGFNNLGYLGLGTTTPFWQVHIASTSPYFAMTNSTAPLNAKTVVVSVNNSGQYAIGSSTDSGSATSSWMTIDGLGNGLSMGSSTPSAKLTVHINQNDIGGAFANALTVASSSANGAATSTLFNLSSKGYLTLSTASGNAIVGNATLVGGTVTVTTAAATASSFVVLTRKTSGGTIGTAITYTVTTGSFTITSDNILDTSVFTWLIVN